MNTGIWSPSSITTKVRATTSGRSRSPGLKCSSRTGDLSGLCYSFGAGGSKCPQGAGVLRLLDRQTGQLDPGIHMSQERELPTLELL